MFIGVHKPKASGAGNNKGSSSTLMEYLAKEDKDTIKEYEEEFLENNEDTLEGHLFEKQELENSILELENKLKSQSNEIDNLDNNDTELLNYYKGQLSNLNEKIDNFKNENSFSLSEDSEFLKKYTEDDFINNRDQLFQLSEIVKETEKEINDLKFQLNNEKFSDDNSYEKLEDDLQFKIDKLKNLESQIDEFKSERDKINLQLEDKTKTFFNSNFENCTKEEATDLIDKQSKGLEKKDAKFYMLSVDPSEKEIKHLLKDIVEDVDKIESIKDLSPAEKKQFESKLKDYTHSVMEEYAKQFDRTKKDGSKLDRNDLVYVAKIEENRKYSHKDRDVVFNRDISKEINKIDNSDLKDKEKISKKAELESQFKLTPSGKVIKENMQKEGFQSHVHIVVSRYDQNKEMKLSPMSNSKGQNDHQVGGRNVQIGFNRVDFKIKCEEKFDQQFSYDRPDYDKASHMIQDKKNQKDNGFTDIKKAVNKDGKVDTIEAYKMYATALKNGTEFMLTGNMKELNTTALIKKFSNEVNPAERLRSMINQINPKQLAIDTVKKALTKGGLEL